MKQISIAVLVLVLFSLAPAAGAQTTVPYMTVDEVAVTYQSIMVTGVVQGSTTSSVRTYTLPSGITDAQKVAALDRCHRSLLLALSKPGQYVAKIAFDTCAIALVTP